MDFSPARNPMQPSFPKAGPRKTPTSPEVRKELYLSRCPCKSLLLAYVKKTDRLESWQVHTAVSLCEVSNTSAGESKVVVGQEETVTIEELG